MHAEIFVFTGSPENEDYIIISLIFFNEENKDSQLVGS